MIGAAAAWLSRQAGVLAAPRTTLAALRPDEGARDSGWALVAWLLATAVFDLVEVVARVAALRTLGATLLAVADVAIALLPPYVATFAIELVLGRARAHRAGTLLAPMIAVGAALHLGAALGLWLPRWGWLPPLLAGVVAVAFAAWVRPAIAPRTERSA